MEMLPRPFRDRDARQPRTEKFNSSRLEDTVLVKVLKSLGLGQPKCCPKIHQ